MIGSSLTTVSAFISVEGALGSATYLAWALSLRTAGFFAFSYFSPYLLNRFGEKLTILGAQFFGLFALTILGLGFESGNPFAICVGIVLAGIPGNLLVTGTVATLKQLVTDPDVFRRLSARREIMSGATLCFAGLVAPLVVPKIGLAMVFFLDAVTYLGAVIALLFLKLPKQNIDSSFPVFPAPRLFLTSDARSFLLSVSGPLVLMATLPMLASSSAIRATLSLSSELFRSMWAIEGLVGVSAGLFYSRFGLKHQNLIVKMFTHVNVVFVLIVFLPVAETVKFLTLCMIPLTYSVAFFYDRDNLLLNAKDDRSLINVYAAFSGLTRSFWGSVSPFVYTVGLGYLSLNSWVLAIFVVQATLLTFTLKRVSK